MHSDTDTYAYTDTDTYITLHSADTKVQPTMFNKNSINFGNDTLLKGNLIVFGHIISLGYDVLTENNQGILYNYGSSAEKGLYSISERSINHAMDYALAISNSILDHANQDIQNMKQSYGIANITSYPNNMFTSNDFNNLFNPKTFDDIKQGTSNRYIVNNEYHSSNPLIIDGKLVASNIYTQTIDIDGNIHADFFYGDGRNIINVNTDLFNTSVLIETPQSSNHYFTSDRVATIAEASNQHTSNYIQYAYYLSADAIQNTDTATSNTILDFHDTVINSYNIHKDHFLDLASNKLAMNITNIDPVS